MLLNVNITTLLSAVSINHTVLNRPSWHLLNNSMGQTAETLHMQHPTNLINQNCWVSQPVSVWCGVALPTVPAAGACYPSHSTSHAALPSIFCFTNLNAINHSTLSEECSQVMQCNGLQWQCKGHEYTIIDVNVTIRLVLKESEVRT